MKSEMGGGKDRKRLLKLANRITDEEVIAYLTGTGRSPSHYFLLKAHGFAVIRVSNPDDSESEVTLDDDAMATAISRFLEKRGAVRHESK